MRLFFIHGFGETPTIFDKITPHLPSNQVLINVWDELQPFDAKGNLNVEIFAKHLADKYQITPTDTVIGHSMGGWIAVHVKQLTGAVCVQIASFTNPKRILVPSHRMGVIKFLHYSGLYLNGFNRWLFSQLSYKNQPSQPLFESIFTDLMKAHKDEVFKQTRILFEPVAGPTVQPDLRIHAKADRVVAPPHEPYEVVPGDHFTLYTMPETVLKAMASVVTRT
ncbi:MAG: alpha/beta hydrolase [Spirosomataceae bacterium]